MVLEDWPWKYNHLRPHRSLGYLTRWAAHFASLFTVLVVTFSRCYVNFLGVGLHNYGFTTGKDAIWMFHVTIGIIMTLAGVAAFIEKGNREAENQIQSRCPRFL